MVLPLQMVGQNLPPLVGIGCAEITVKLFDKMLNKRNLIKIINLCTVFDGNRLLRNISAMPLEKPITVHVPL